MPHDMTRFFLRAFVSHGFHGLGRQRPPPPTIKKTQFFWTQSFPITTCSTFKLPTHEAWDAMQPWRKEGQTGEMKQPFKIDTNRFIKGQKLHGRTKLILSNAFLDSAFMKEKLG